MWEQRNSAQQQSEVEHNFVLTVALRIRPENRPSARPTGKDYSLIGSYFDFSFRLTGPLFLLGGLEGYLIEIHLQLKSLMKSSRCTTFLMSALVAHPPPHVLVHGSLFNLRMVSVE